MGREGIEPPKHEAAGLQPAGLTSDQCLPAKSGWQDSNLRDACSQSRWGARLPNIPLVPPERFELPTSWAETRHSRSAELRGHSADLRRRQPRTDQRLPYLRDTDGQIRTDTGQVLNLVPLPVGLRRREVESEGIEPSRATVQESSAGPQHDPSGVDERPSGNTLTQFIRQPTEEELNPRLPSFNRALEPFQLSVVGGQCGTRTRVCGFAGRRKRHSPTWPMRSGRRGRTLISWFRARSPTG